MSHLTSSAYGSADGPRCERTELNHCWVSCGFGEGEGDGDGDRDGDGPPIRNSRERERDLLQTKELRNGNSQGPCNTCPRKGIW